MSHLPVLPPTEIIETGPTCATCTTRTYRGFWPFDVSPPAGAPFFWRGSYTRHSGCVLRISHPLDALLPRRPTKLISSWIRLWGSPFEVCHTKQQAVRPLERRSPHAVGRPVARAPSTSGFSTYCPVSSPKPWGLTKTRNDDLRGLLSLRGLSIQRRLRPNRSWAPLHPLSRFRDASNAWLRHRRPRVLSTEHHAHLIETGEPPWGFSPSRRLASSSASGSGAHFLPSEVGLRHRSLRTSSLLPPRSLPPK